MGQRDKFDFLMFIDKTEYTKTVNIVTEFKSFPYTCNTSIQISLITTIICNTIHYQTTQLSRCRLFPTADADGGRTVHPGGRRGGQEHHHHLLHDGGGRRPGQRPQDIPGEMLVLRGAAGGGGRQVLPKLSLKMIMMISMIRRIKSYYDE